MKSTYNIVLLLLLPLLFSCNSKPHYTINGVFKEGIGKQIILEDISDNTSVKIIDSCIVDKNGNFYFEGTTSGSIIEAKLSIKGTKHKEELLIEDTLIKVNVVSNQTTAHNKTSNYKFIIDRSYEDALYLKLKNNYSSRRQQWGIMTNEYVVAHREQRMSEGELKMARTKLDNEFNSDIIDTLANYPTNSATAFYIKNYMLRFDSLSLIEKAFNNLSKQIQESETGVLLKSGIEEVKMACVGGTPANFSIPSLDGGITTLYQYRGKVLLIDCWATWCGPCVKAMPHIGEIHKKYNPAGLEVLGISYDKDEMKWRNFIKKNDYIVWDQASSIKEWNCPTAKLFALKSIPETILFDKNGVIAARGLNGKELEAKIEELLEIE